MRESLKEYIQRTIKELTESNYPLRQLDPLAHSVLTKPVRNRGLGFNPAYVDKVEMLQAMEPTFRVFTKNQEYFDLTNLDNRMIKLKMGAETYDLMDMHQRQEASRELSRLLQRGKNTAATSQEEEPDDLDLEPEAGDSEDIQEMKRYLREHYDYDQGMSEYDKKYKNTDDDITIYDVQEGRRDNSGPWATTGTSSSLIHVMSRDGNRLGKDDIRKWAESVPGFGESYLITQKIGDIHETVPGEWAFELTTTVWYN